MKRIAGLRAAQRCAQIHNSPEIGDRTQTLRDDRALTRSAETLGSHMQTGAIAIREGNLKPKIIPSL